MTINRTVAALAACALAALPAAAQDINADPNYGTINLTSGFTPDPQVISLQSGGQINAERVSSSCRGFISGAPDVRLVFSAGNTLPLIVSVNSNADTTLVINAPDGSWYCDDDGGNRGLNPSIRWNRPMSGRYEIWVGTYGNASLQPADLHISELYSQ
jgi:hypothetical protein